MDYLIIIIIALGLFGIKQMISSIIKKKRNAKRSNTVNNFYKNNKEKLDALCKQYYAATQRLIEALEEDVDGIFKVQAFWGRLTHKIFAKDLLSTIYVEKDGYSEPLYLDREKITANEKKIVNFIDILKTKISSEWNNDETLNLAIYFILRYNFIKYKSDYYELNYGFVNIDGICQYAFDTKENLDEIVRLFTYYWIFQNDINLPITITYEKMSATSKKVYSYIELEKEKDNYFWEIKNILILLIRKDVITTNYL